MVYLKEEISDDVTDDVTLEQSCGFWDFGLIIDGYARNYSTEYMIC